MINMINMINMIKMCYLGNVIMILCNYGLDQIFYREVRNAKIMVPGG